jgi:hypothetical protein
VLVGQLLDREWKLEVAERRVGPGCFGDEFRDVEVDLVSAVPELFRETRRGAGHDMPFSLTTDWSVYRARRGQVAESIYG